MNHRVGINFHEGLQLTRARLAVVLRFLRDNPGSSREELRRGTDLGANMVIAMPNLGIGAGLFKDLGRGRGLTTLGEVVVEHDPYLERIESLWLIHFGLVEPAGNGPRYWVQLMLDTLAVGCEMSIPELVEDVAANETVIRSKIQSAVSKLVDAYSKDDLLGQLGLLQKNGDVFLASPPRTPVSAGVLAYALAKRWEDLHAGQLTTGLDAFVEASQLRQVFRVSRDELRNVLEDVRRHGLIELYTTAPPYQLVRRWHDLSEVISQAYAF